MTQQPCPQQQGRALASLPDPVPGPDGLYWYSVHIELPDEVEATITHYLEQDEFACWTVALHGALYGYRSTVWSPEALRDELVAMTREAMDDVDAGRGSEVTPTFWEELARKCELQSQQVDELQRTGQLGNLLLPKELYAFMRDEIAAGKFNNPSEMICAVMPFLWDQAGADDGHEEP
jgi:hypothetical protein